MVPPLGDDAETTVDAVTEHRPRALIVTLYGAYARDLGDWISVAALIRRMAELGVDETSSVRASVSRLERRAMLVAERRAGIAGYSLSADAHVMLA
jgi:phenylacetic acid degradation operon negative regulatory protein